MCIFLCSCFIFFFSSRRRHTRYIGDWSSDVCSSDLTRDVAQQIGDGLRVRHCEGVRCKRVARAARQRALRSGRGEHREVRHDRVAAGGGVTPRRGIAHRRVDLGDGSSCEREQGGRAEETAGHAPARFRMNSLKSRTPMPVGPFAWWGTSPSVYAVPAISRWTQGNPLANSRKNQPPAIVPAPRPPEFFISALSDFSTSR